MQRPVLSVCGVIALFATVLVARQSSDLRVLVASPAGELQQLQEANEIRIIFSEPMVALGRIPDNPTPPWIRITPAIKGTYRWSGTTILLFTPDPATPLPHATRYTVTIDPSATAASGKQLGSAITATTFTTPTVRMISAQWMRQGNRFDRPAVLALLFNQRVRPEDVVSHLIVRYEQHDPQVPTFSDGERARLQAIDPAGLKRFDAKVAAARQTAARSDVIATRIAADWDRTRFKPSDRLVVLETSTVPPPGSWFELTLDARMPSPEGREVPPAEQASIVELDRAFFAMPPECRTECDPSYYNAVDFSGVVRTTQFARALTVRDITDPARETAVARASPVTATEQERGWSHSVEDAGFNGQPPARTWALRLDPSLEAFDGQVLGYPWIGIIENWHERAFTSFGDGHGVWEKDGGPQLPFYSRNYRTVTERLVRLSVSDLMPRILALEKSNFAEFPPGAGTVRKLPVTPDEIQSHGLSLSSVLSAAGTGLAWVGIEPGEAIPRSKAVPRTTSTVVQVTNLGISVKDSPQSTLVFVTRLDNAEPVADARVTIVNTENKQVWRGATGRDGVVLAPALPLRDPENWYRLSFLVTAEKDGDIAYAASDWNEGISPWDFGQSYQLWEATDILRGSIFTDRGVYKPGEELHLKAIVRADTPNGIRLLPAGSTLDVRVRDTRSKEVDRRTVKLNRWSSAEWTWTVPADATLGNYSVQVMLPGTEQPEGNDASPRRRAQGEWLKRVHGSFLVAAYRRPDFRVDTTLTADPAIAGRPMRASLTARYLFGGLMAKRPVKWSLVRQPEFGVPNAIREKFPDDKFAFGYYPDRETRGDPRVAGEDAALDAQGTLSLDLPSDAKVDVAYRYTFEADVEDLSRQHIANRSSVVIHPAPWYIGVRRPAYFANTKDGTSVDVVAVTPQGEVTPGVAVKLSLVRVQWNSVRRAEGSGFYTWETERIEVPAGEWTVTTAEKPVTLALPVPDGGFYTLHATATDAEGRTARTDAYFYGLGAGYTAWERFDHNRITLEPEKKTWKPGETARIMVQSPWERATALLTVEREGVRSYERFTLTSTQQTVEVKISESDIPNVYVSVLLIRGRTSTDPGSDGSDPGKPAFRLGYTELAVADDSKKLGVKVSADRAEYRPANRARVSVEVADATGKPAASEVTLWAVDYGVLSLTDYRAPDVLRAVYQEKSLQVMNADSRQRIVSRRVLTPKGANEGGGGGESTVRTDFRPLAFWLGSVETDGNGRATREVTLPESLTTYRIMAVAGDSSSRFGSAGAEIRVTKPVTMLPAFPRFLTLGDRATFGAVVTNTLATGGEGTVTVRSLDPGVEFAGPTSMAVRLDPGQTLPVRFDAVARTVGPARVQMTVKLGANTDAFEMTLPVTAPSRLETSAAFGDTVEKAVEKLAIPAGVLAGPGGLTVELASSALVGLGEGARYLYDYPYWCAEQKASAALALVLAADLGNAFSMGRIAPADYRKRAAEMLKDLPRYQCSDGGFNYWPGGCLWGDVYLTSYVLHVMDVADGLGIPPDQEVVERALDFLDNAMKSEPPTQVQWQPAWTATNAFALKILTEYGRTEDSNITRLLKYVDRMPIFAQSFLADAMAAAQTRGPRYDDLVRRLTNAARVEGDRAQIEELDTDELAWLWNSNVRATALVLDGLVRRGDDPLLVPRFVRWLLAARTNGRWRNTQENATALEALVTYYKKYEAEIPNMTATVGLGRGTVGTATFRGRSSQAQSVRLVMPELLRQIAAGTEQDLTISRAGTGRLYYTARLQYVPIEPPPPSDQGIRVERRYERFVEGSDSPAATSFAAGDLIRVTLTMTLPKERRFVAVTDALPAGVEAVDGWFRTTAADLARDASRQGESRSSWSWWRRGGFDYVEKFDDRVALFATRLSEGRHEFSYLVRATTAGTFRVTGTWAEEMYAPEVNGRTAPVTIVIK